MVYTDEMIPDMRSIKETAARFKLPVNFVRRLVLDGKVVAVQAGRKKFYVNQESVAALLNGGKQHGVQEQV